MVIIYFKHHKVQRTAARWTCGGWRNTSDVGEMLGELKWPSLEARRDQSYLLLFHKIHCGAVSIEKDKYMTPAHSLKTTRSSHSAQYRRRRACSGALGGPFSPELFHIGIVCLLLWQIPSPQRSLGHSLFKQKFSQKFFFLCCFVFLCCFCFYSIKISKFALPGVMLMYDRTSKDRKKERNSITYCQATTILQINNMQQEADMVRMLVSFYTPNS